VEPDILRGIHEQKLRLDSELELAGWITDHGMDAKKFLELARSEQIVAKADEVDKLARACRVEAVPWIVVDGRFVPVIGMSYDAALIVTGKLVELVRNERSGKKAS
jgi:thiol:disulfide interchange protein DsbA